jgi:pre-mRNA-processing factor 40
MDENEKKQKEDRRKKRKEFVEKIKATYDSNADITVLSRWRDVQDILKEDETFKWLSKLEALTSWEEWVADREKAELTSKSTAKFRVERKKRDAFKELIDEQSAKGKITMSTLWPDLVESCQKDPRYLDLLGHPGSTPHDLFDDFVEDLSDKYKEGRAKIKKIAKAKGLVVTSTVSYSWFNDELKDEEGFLDIPESYRKEVFDSLVTKAKEQDEDNEKNAKKNRKKFVELLQKTREVTAKTTYESAAKMLKSNAAWDAVEEVTRRQCFDIFVDQLKKQSAARGDASDDGPSGDEDDDRRRKEPAKKPKKKERAEEFEEPKRGKKSKKDDDRSEEPPPKAQKKTKKK